MYVFLQVKELGEQWKVCPERVESITCVKNEGWASQVIQKWVELASKTPNQGEEPKTAKFCMYHTVYIYHKEKSNSTDLNFQNKYFKNL